MVKKTEISEKQLLETIVESIKERKGKSIVIIDLSKLENPITQYFVICHGTSTTQVEAIAEYVEKQVKDSFSVKVKHIEGKRNAQWILIDLYDVIVHVFLEDVRRYYNLEQLWADGEFTYINDEND